MNNQNKARVETIMMNAHTEGNGIKTALIPVDLCELSPIYQRDQGRHVAHIASNWDDNKAGHLEASERGDHFNIWDGGNRLRAAIMIGKTHVLCNIRTGLTDEDEAHLFVTQEENVTKLTQYDKFIAACASGEERGKVALLLRDICGEYGIKIKKACGKNSAGVLTAIGVALAITCLLYTSFPNVNSFLLSKEKEEQSPPKSQSECSKISSIIIAFTKGSDY